MLKPVIESHHLAQPFQKSLLLLQSIRKCDIVSILLQYEHMSSVFIPMFFNHSLHGNVLCITLYWKVCFEVCLVHKKGILKIVFQKLLSLP